MKLGDIIILSFAVGFCLIGFDQTFSNGFYENYWIFMITIILLSWYQYRKNKRKEEEK